MQGKIIKRVGKRKTSYQVVVDVGGGAKDNRKQIKKTFDKKKDADLFLAETIASVKKGTFIIPTKLTVKEYLTDWLDTYCMQNLTVTTYQGYKIVIEKHLIPALGHIPLSELKPKQIHDYYNEALKEGRKDGKKKLGRKLSPTTVNQHHRILRKALQHALKLEMIIANPADKVDPPKKAKNEITFLSSEDANKVIELFNNDGDYMYIPVYLALMTGMRRGEILGVKWSDIDFKHGLINVNRALYITKEQGMVFKEPKNATSRRNIAISPKVKKVLKKHKARLDEDKLSAGESYNDSNLVCCLADGSPLNPATVSSRFHEVTSRAKFDLRFHDLRHAHASFLLKQGVHPKVVSERLGHSNISMTMDLYSHIAPTLQREAADRLDALFSS